ncbi:MAG TPA: hypothetical protein VM689_20970 [Aliidongia sp.]|nr:hypothetical protein [Aliidongia sp.]
MLAKPADAERDEERADLRLRDALAAHGMLPMADVEIVQPVPEAGDPVPTATPG